MINADHQRAEFQGRISRIKKGGPNTFGQVYVGPVEEAAAQGESRPHFGILATIWSVILGSLAYLAGNLGQFHLLSQDGRFAPEDLGEQAALVASMAGDLLLAFLVLGFLLKLSRLRGFAPWLVGMIGIFAMMGMHGTVLRLSPDISAALYSESYIADRLSYPLGSLPD